MAEKSAPKKAVPKKAGNKQPGPPTLTQRKKAIAAMNKILKEHNFMGFKISNIQLAATAAHANLNDDCETLQCDSDTEDKITIVHNNGRTTCICKRRDT